jgi:hypothetical protein
MTIVRTTKDVTNVIIARIKNPFCNVIFGCLYKLGNLEIPILKFLKFLHASMISFYLVVTTARLSSRIVINFVLIHAMPSHPFAVLLCVESHSKEE